MDEIVHFFYGEVTGHSHQSTSQNGHPHYHNNTERRLDFIERFDHVVSFEFIAFDWLIVADILVPVLCVGIPVTFHKLDMVLLTIKGRAVLYLTGHIIQFFTGI